MRRSTRTGRWLAAFCAIAALGAAPAQSAFDDPLFVFIPKPLATVPPLPLPPTGYLNGPCGLAVDSSARFYVSDYYHDAVSVFRLPENLDESPTYFTQLTPVDPLDGPCGLALDASGSLYVNDYHRNVVKFGASPSFAAGPVFDAEHPTGVAVNPASGNVYVNNRTYISAYRSTGAPLLDDGGQPLRIGLGTLGDGYGLAVSQFPATLGQLYVPDASTDTVKVYDPLVDTVNPIAEIEDPFGNPFSSLRDSAVAVDRLSGDIYFADNVQPVHTERPEATIHVYSYANAYKGHLKYNIVDALPPGLAVDNSATATQGLVYVTSGNTNEAGIYAYPPGAATIAEPQPSTFTLALSATGTGDGRIASAPAGVECAATCGVQLRAGREVSLSASAAPGSAFEGWSGGGCSGTGTCTVEMSKATSVGARFVALPSGDGGDGSRSPLVAPTAAPQSVAAPAAGASPRGRPSRRRHAHLRRHAHRRRAAQRRCRARQRLHRSRSRRRAARSRVKRQRLKQRRCAAGKRSNRQRRGRR